MFINEAKPERDTVVELLMESSLVLDMAFACFEDLEYEDFDGIVKSVSAIKKKVSSIYICDDSFSRDQIMPEPLRRKFYEESAAEMFRIHRFLNECHGKENVVL